MVTVFTTCAVGGWLDGSVGGWLENWRVMLSTALNFWAKKMLVNKYKDPKYLGPKCLVKIRSVTAEIMLIWTIVTGQMLTEQKLP